MWAAANSRGDDFRRAKDVAVDSEEDYSSSDGERSTTSSVGGDPPPPAAGELGRKRKKDVRRHRRRKKRTVRLEIYESPEATVSRLKSAYSAALAAIGALHRVSNQYCSRTMEPDLQNDMMQGPSNDSDDKVGKQLEDVTYSSIRRVAEAARAALEQSLLPDPHVLATIVFSGRGENSTSAWMDTYQSIEAPRIFPQPALLKRWERLNAANRGKIQRIAYLGLVNYGDLLLCGCKMNSEVGGDGGLLLDKGAVPRLNVLDRLMEDDASLWPEEETYRTIRLSLSAYCDASELDSSDPTLWYKLACCARQLGRHESIQDIPSSFRSLERFAIERGLNSLRPSLPPNRLLMRAWREVEDETHNFAIPDGSVDDTRSVFVLRLQMRTWAALGTTLVNAFRGGVGNSYLTDLGSPCIKVSLPPLLSVPLGLVAMIGSFLSKEKGSRDIASLACTCRALSCCNGNPATADRLKTRYRDSEPSAPVHDAQAKSDQETSKVSSDPSDANDKRISKRSKRVRSQQLSTEKQLERTYRASSVRYCLLAGSISFKEPSPMYNRSIKAHIQWDKLPFIQGLPVPQLLATAHADDLSDNMSTLRTSLEKQPNSRGLEKFIDRWNEFNSGPRQILEAFILNVSINFEGVFEEPKAPLASCFIESFACLAGDGSDSIPWFGPDRVNRSAPLQEQINSCSVNLLASELLFERKESQTLSTFESSTLAFLVPNLVGFSTVLSEMEEDNPEVVRFSCRCCWIAALYYNKIAQCSSDDATAAEAEQFSLECLDRAESLLQKHSLVISTKHLSVHEISMDQIIARRTHISATYVVSKARENFSALTKSVIGRQDGDFELEDDEKKTLANIAHALIERYMSGSTGIIDELLDDFLALNDAAVPSSKEESLVSISRLPGSRRSILHIIVTSLYAADKSTAPLIGLYTHLLERLAARLKSSDSGSVATLPVHAAVVFVFHKLAKLPFSESDLSKNALIIAGVVYTLPRERDVMEAVSTLLSSLREKSDPSNEGLDIGGNDGKNYSKSVHTIQCSFFSKMVKDLIFQRRAIGEHLDSSHRKDRRSKLWQQELLRLADSVSTLSAHLSNMLSLYPVHNSPLVRALESVDYGHAPLCQLLEAAIFLWENLQSVGNSLNLARSRLLVPVGSLLLSLSYPLRSTSITISPAEDVGVDDDDDFFDSDSSSQGAFLSARDGEQRTMLRRIAQAAQVAALVFKSLQGQEISEPSLVCVRVLSSLSDSLFALFNSSAESDDWPFGARDIGSKIDGTLCKAYRYLYGFGLDSSETDSTRTHRPLTISNARHLFFFLKRFYKHKRGSPPPRAFEMVLSALPREEDNPTALAIMNYMFSTNEPDYSIPLTSESSIPVWIFEQSGTDHRHNPSEDEELLSVQRLRRAVSHELAKGSINSLDTFEDDDERKSTAASELALIKKTFAILDDLSTHPSNQMGWMNLSEACGFRAELILDRILPDRNTDDSQKHPSYSLEPGLKRASPATLTLKELEQVQAEEYETACRDWTPFIGVNLRPYLQHPWSSTKSLQNCAEQIGAALANSTHDRDDTKGVDQWKKIQVNYEQGSKAKWMTNWAGIFISALRTLRMRALMVARHLSSLITISGRQSLYPSEVSEDIGTAVYSELMSSFTYGFPIRSMTLHEKRGIAKLSAFFFNEAIDLSEDERFSDKSSTTVFEVRFMVGKSLEKISSTLQDESYLLCNAIQGETSRRKYEAYMAEALASYSKALAEASKVSDKATPKQIDVGGSSHGSLEVLYRLHATRLKVITTAALRSKEECSIAEKEGIRLASTAWFNSLNKPNASASLRNQVWSLLADCCDAMINCRKKQPLFHRAAFRLAQAYNYAPVFHRPDCQLDSSACVPDVKTFTIPGLAAGPCAESAAEVIGTLFDKKRDHLCSVWQTTSNAPTPFEVINDSIRKYDKLRLKYILAFIDSMRLCKKRDRIELLFQMASKSAQDMPTYYEATVTPGVIANQTLLTSSQGFLAQVKLAAIDALAQLILQDLLELSTTKAIDTDGRALLERDLRMATSLYKGFCASPNEMAEYIKSTGPLRVVNAMCLCFLSIQGGHRIKTSLQFDLMTADSLCSLIEASLQKAKDVANREKVARRAEKDSRPTK